MKTSSTKPQDMAVGWELLPHDADVRVHGWGPTVEAAFEQAALALTATVTNAKVAGKTAVNVTCEATDVELLLVEWLNAIIYEIAVSGMLFGRFEVRIDGTRLEGTLWGEPTDQELHKPACEPKGATYTALHVAEEAQGRWSATCVVDV
ncbi:MAG: archease [Hyphomicrobiales bacterium]|nr:archease [Hyphomicrobiales bacterium]